MNVMSSAADMELIVLDLQPGQMLLESIRRAVDQESIRNGLVVSGIGTLKNLRMHYIAHTDFPLRDELVNIERPLELLSVSGGMMPLGAAGMIASGPRWDRKERRKE